MSEATKVGRDFSFFFSMIGLFKTGSWVLNLIALIILSTTQFWGVARIRAVAASYFTFSFVAVTLLISIFIYACKLYNVPLVSRLPWKLLEVAYAGLCAILYFISMCICAWAANHLSNTNIHGTLAASAVFAAILLILFLVFGFFTWRADGIRSKPATSVNT